MLEPLSILGIGSVPFSQNKNSCKEIFENWDIPFWPQYPRRTLRENLVFQFLSSFPGLAVSDKSATFNKEEFLAGEVTYRKALEQALTQKDPLSFEPPSDWALGYAQMKELLAQSLSSQPIVKLQITSPATVWCAFFKTRVNDFASRVWKILNLTLIASGLSQIRRVLSLDKTPLIFIDEPLRQNETGYLQEMVQTFKNEKALVGLHLCSNQDWSGYEKLEFDVFHFDLTIYKELSLKLKDFLRQLLHRKGWLAWGIMPATAIEASSVTSSTQNLLMWAKKIAAPDLSVEQILDQSLLAPSCGLGTLTFEQEESIFRQLRALSRELKHLRSHLTEEN